MDFIKSRGVAYGLSLALTVVGAAALVLLPKNLGIDMTGGVMVEVKASSGTVDRAVADKVVAAAKDISYSGSKAVTEASAYPVVGTDLTRVEAGFKSDLPVEALAAAKAAFRAKVPELFLASGITVSESRYSDIGQSFGDYVKKTAYLTLVLAIIAIAAYIGWAFRRSVQGISSMSLGFVTIITLIYDVVATAGIYVIIGLFFPQFKFDTFLITALLTILGYCINDTIVILDRIRATVRDRKVGNMTLDRLVDTSVHAVLMRSIYTHLTLFLVLLSLFFFGPETLQGFMLALLVGTTVGTYSSIWVAAPLVYDLNKSGYRK